MINIEVGKKYEDNKGVLIEVIKKEGYKIWPSYDNGLLDSSWFHETSEYAKGLKPYEEQITISRERIGVWDMDKVEINLDTHIGKVNSDELYEFSDIDGKWFKGYLLWINSKVDNKFLCVRESDLFEDWYPYCRLYKEEKKEKEYMTRPQVQWFLNKLSKEKCVVVALKSAPKDDDNRWFLFDDGDIYKTNIQEHEWTTIDDETKEYGEAQEFLVDYMDGVK